MRDSNPSGTVCRHCGEGIEQLDRIWWGQSKYCVRNMLGHEPAPPAEQPRRDGHSALRLNDGKFESFDPHPRIGGEIQISVTEDGFICSFGKESRTSSSWAEIVAWLKHHGEATIKNSAPVAASPAEPTLKTILQDARTDVQSRPAWEQERVYGVFPPEGPRWNEQEQSVIADLAKRLDISHSKVLQLALRRYQMEILGIPDLGSKATQPVPDAAKVAEIADKCVELAKKKCDEAIEEGVLDIRQSDFAAILRPYFPTTAPPNPYGDGRMRCAECQEPVCDHIAEKLIPALKANRCLKNLPEASGLAGESTEKINGQAEIDIKNLRFYADMADENDWDTLQISSGVISQTLREIADRLAGEVTQGPPICPEFCRPMQKSMRGVFSETPTIYYFCDSCAPSSAPEGTASPLPDAIATNLDYQFRMAIKEGRDEEFTLQLIKNALGDYEAIKGSTSK